VIGRPVLALAFVSLWVAEVVLYTARLFVPS